MTEGLKTRPEHNDDRMEAAVSSARQRLLEADQPQVSPAATSEQRFVEVPARGKQYRVPDPQWYSLTAEQKSRYLDAIDGAGQQEKDESVALQSVNQLLDLRDKDQAKAQQRESALMDVIAELTARVTALEAVDRDHRIEASEELAKQQTQMADAVLNAAAMEASLRNQTAQSQAAHDQQGVEAQSRLQAMEQPVTQLEERVRSTVTLMQERGNAVVDQVAAAEGRQARLGVTLTELEGQTDAIGQPITRAEMAGMVDQKVAAEFTSKVTNERVAEVVRRNFIQAAPTTSIDALNLPDPEFAPVGDDATERAVSRALKS